ncbi:hypothetical protein J9303_11675 [Bacillaceae bacterium Marseille-Q3522]|nr:hypothetical protein [Bacillaceae bacterium Marseille-Q3522]
MKHTNTIPDNLSNTFFFPEGELEWEEKEAVTFVKEKLFLYDFLYHIGRQAFQPWQHVQEILPVLLAQWEEQKRTLISLFTKRQKNTALEPMKLAIGYFIQLLFWTNQKPVVLQKEALPILKIKPVNIDERLHFILSRPNEYHSFVQLSQLYLELVKQYRKQEAMKKWKVKKS